MAMKTLLTEQMNRRLEMPGGVKYEWRSDLTPELLAVTPWWDTTSPQV